MEITLTDLRPHREIGVSSLKTDMGPMMVIRLCVYVQFLMHPVVWLINVIHSTPTGYVRFVLMYVCRF